MRRDEKDYGKLNPKAPAELARWAFLIGARSGEAKLKQDDGTWQTLRTTWEGRYILDGYAIEDAYRRTAGARLEFPGLRREERNLEHEMVERAERRLDGSGRSQAGRRARR